jgi:glycosyltransferase involved in cell wall biosynthesis
MPIDTAGNSSENEDAQRKVRSSQNAGQGTPTSRTRICLLADDLGGGTGNHLLALTRHWDPEHWHASILAQAPVSARVRPRIPITVVGPSRWLAHYPFAQVRRFMASRRYVAACQPQIVHTYFFWSIIFGRLLKRSGAVPYLVENREDQGFNWGRHEYTLLRLTRSLPDRIVCVSEAVRSTVLREEQTDPNRVIVLHNGTEPPSDNQGQGLRLRKAFGFEPGQLIVGLVANFNRRVKGVSYFVDAVPAILKAVPDARFLLIGRGNEEDALRRQVRSLGVDQYVVFAGYQENIAAHYAMMDISVLTSLTEGLSLTVLESMQAGLPLVVTRVGGNPEVVVDGETGFLVPPRDVPAFVKRVVTLLRNRALRQQMGSAAKEHVRRRFYLPDVARRYLELYDALAGSHPPA